MSPWASSAGDGAQTLISKASRPPATCDWARQPTTVTPAATRPLGSRRQSPVAEDALTHCSGQGIKAIGVPHHQSAASALLAGFRSRDELPPVLCPFVGFNSQGNHFCLCMPGDICASGELRSDAALWGVIVRVRRHRQVSCARVALRHCGVLCCEESTRDSWGRSQAAVLATLCYIKSAFLTAVRFAGGTLVCNLILPQQFAPPQIAVI